MRSGWPVLAPAGRTATVVLAVVVVLAGASAAGALAVIDRGERLVWSDTFSGSAGSAPSPQRWTYDLGANGWGNHELQCYTNSQANSALDGDGHLVITARRQASRCGDGRDVRYTSARLLTRGLHSFRAGGRIVVRAALPSLRGSWPAIWMLGDSVATESWPRCGEIDIAEATQRLPGTVQGSVHVAGPNGGPVTRTASSPLGAGFHDFELRWDRDRLAIAVDGRVYRTVSRADLPSWPFDRPFHLLLNVAVGGIYGGVPDPSAPWPARMVIDSVRAYE